MLLFPDLPDGPVEALPDPTVESGDAVAWFSVEARSIVTETGAGTETPNSKRIWAVREHLSQLASNSRFYGSMKDILNRPEPLKAAGLDAISPAAPPTCSDGRPRCAWHRTVG